MILIDHLCFPTQSRKSWGLIISNSFHFRVDCVLNLEGVGIGDRFILYQYDEFFYIYIFLTNLLV